MPTGVMINVTAVILGGLTGSILGSRLSENLKETMNSILGMCALCMGISTVVLMKNLPAVVFSVILGTLIGLGLRFGIGIQKASGMVLNRVMKDVSSEISDMMLTAVVLFCASGTGIYGALDAGMTGNHSVLVAKAVLDFFTAMIFACKLGKAVSFIGIPQFVTLFAIFLSGQGDCAPDHRCDGGGFQGLRRLCAGGHGPSDYEAEEFSGGGYDSGHDHRHACQLCLDHLAAAPDWIVFKTAIRKDCSFSSCRKIPSGFSASFCSLLRA